MLAAWILAILSNSAPVWPIQAGTFPFTKDAMRFYLNGQPVFLHVIGYQPLEPDQPVTGELREARVLDDLRRFRAFTGGSDPMVLRLYPQPTSQFPNRLRPNFYDEVRRLGFWVIRDIYFDADWAAADAKERGRQKINAVLAEVANANAFDRVFAWEVGNEFTGTTEAQRSGIADFINTMRVHLKSRMAESDKAGWSDWVTWGSWPPSDPLRSSATVPNSSGGPILPTLDFAAYNAYTFWPERMRFAGCGPVTGTPYAGYLAALKARHPSVPLLISETGYPDSPVAVGENQARLHPWYPNYRRGALHAGQIAEALADRYWDARLSGLVAGIGFFEWNDEAWKGDGGDQAEPHFGLMRFTTTASGAFEGRFKLQAQTIRELFTLRLPSSTPVISGVSAADASLSLGESTTLQALVAPEAVQPLRFRWESDRGWIIGDGQTVTFFTGTRALGPAHITVVGVDARDNATMAGTTIAIQGDGAPAVEFLTLGPYRASGRVSNLDASVHKLSLWIETNQQYVQPFADAKEQYISRDGYWWSFGWSFSSGIGRAYVVPRDWTSPEILPIGVVPPGTIAQASRSVINDAGNDLLPDGFASDPYADSDSDGAQNLEELLAGTNAITSDNDQDHDGLADHWERLYFGHLGYGPDEDPDGDGLGNATEQDLELHPGRTAADSDRDGMPDTWERMYFGNLDRDGTGDANTDGVLDLDAFELGVRPIPAPPTAAGLAGIQAVRAPGGAVTVTWSVWVEVGVLGYHLERRVGDDAWRRITPALIPSAPTSGLEPRPLRYHYADLAAAALEQPLYRLVEVDRAAHERVIATIRLGSSLALAIQRGENGLQLQVMGRPNARVRLESNRHLGDPGWEVARVVELDRLGHAEVALDLPPLMSTSFYRAVTETPEPSR